MNTTQPTPTPEQYEAHKGYRLLDDDEKGFTFNARPFLPEIEMQSGRGEWVGGHQGYMPYDPYRTRLSRAELRAKRGLPPEAKPPVWRRSTDGAPGRHHLPFLLQRRGQIDPILFTDSLPLEGDGYLWYPIQLPARPEPTQAEKDEKAADAFNKTGQYTVFYDDVRKTSFLAGVRYARSNQA